MQIRPTLFFLLPLSTDCTVKHHKLHFSLNGDAAPSLSTRSISVGGGGRCLDNLGGGWVVSLGGSLFREEDK